MMLYTIIDIINAARKRGSHWFQPETLEFWGTELFDEITPDDNGGAYFFTEEDDLNCTARLFSVRHCTKDGEISTPHFQEHATYEEVKAAIKYITTFQWKRDVPIWAVYRFMDIKEKWHQNHGPMDDGIHMTDWKATPKGGKLIYSSDSVEYMVQLYK